MSQKILIRRGAQDAMPTLEFSELGIALDTSRLYFGDGIGNRLIGNSYSSVKSAVITQADITLDKTNYAVLCRATADRYIYLPDASGNQGQIFIIKKISGNKKVYIVPAGADTIEGQISVTLSKIGESVEIIAADASWWIL